jgi:hypothetical protein
VHGSCSLLNEFGYIVRVGHHGDMAGCDFHSRCGHALGEKVLGIGRDRLVILGNQVSRRQRFPYWHAHDIVEGAERDRLLHRQQ